MKKFHYWYWKLLLLFDKRKALKYYLKHNRNSQHEVEFTEFNEWKE